MEPDVGSEVDYGGTDDEDEEPRRIVDDDLDGVTRPLSEYEERVAVAIVHNNYEELVENNRCWRCSHIFPTGAHICSYCAAPLTEHPEDQLTISQQATEASK